MKNINYKVILNLISVLMLFNALFMTLCVLVAFIYQETTFLPFLFSCLLTALVGNSIYFSTKNAPKKLSLRDGYLIVGTGWICLILSGALPYLFSIPYLSAHHFNQNDFSITNVFFETIAGYTTTGATIFNDVEILPKSILFWRSLTQWIGGMGIIVLTIAILPLLGIGGMQLFVVEAPVVSANKIHPRITDTAKRLWMVYVLLTLAQIILMVFAGMGWFDAINHALTTLSSGGFSTKNDSTAYWNSTPSIQYILIFFMFLSGINFVLNHFLLKFDFKKIFQNEEFRWYLGMIVSFSILIGLMLTFWIHDTNFTTEASFRNSFFHVISIVTTTGFTSTDYSQWSPFITMLFFSLLFVGGSAGSTSGGVKVIRHVILLKNSLLEFKRLIHPNAVLPVRYNKKSIAQNIVYNILAFFVMYLFIWIFGAIFLALVNNGLHSNYEEFMSAMSLSAASLGNTGVGFGANGPGSSMAALTPIAKWFCAFLMILGRLELFTILILFSPHLWRNN